MAAGGPVDAPPGTVAVRVSVAPSVDGFAEVVRVTVVCAWSRAAAAASKKSLGIDMRVPYCPKTCTSARLRYPAAESCTRT